MEIKTVYGESIPSLKKMEGSHKQMIRLREHLKDLSKATGTG